VILESSCVYCRSLYRLENWIHSTDDWLQSQDLML